MRDGTMLKYTPMCSSKCTVDCPGKKEYRKYEHYDRGFEHRHDVMEQKSLDNHARYGNDSVKLIRQKASAPFVKYMSAIIVHLLRRGDNTNLGNLRN